MASAEETRWWGGATQTFRLNWIAFVVAFGIGIIYITAIEPQRKVLVKYPSPYDPKDTIYKTKTGETCYRFVVTKVDCPSDKTKIRRQPIEALEI